MMSLAILLATYNGEKYLAEQLDSLFSQTYSDFTIYAHDDGSTDNTVNILNDYQRRHPDRLIILDYAPTGGAKNNFFSLMQRVEADYYMFCDQDDVWLPEKIELTFHHEILVEENNPNLPIVIFTDLSIVDKELNIIYKSLMLTYKYNPKAQSICTVLAGNIAFGCTMLFNKKCRDLAVQISNINNFTMHDTLMMLIALSCGKAKYVANQTIYYRQHSKNTVGLKDKDIGFWIKDKINNFLHGRQLEESKKKIIMQKRMISEISNFNDLLSENKTLIEELDKVLFTNKMERMIIYFKYGLLNNSWKNRWKIVLV